MAKIIAVDDEESILQIIKKGLEKDGHEVSAYTNVTQIRKDTLKYFDIMLLDVMMPEVNGFEYCRQIREEVDFPILFLTAKALEEDILEGLHIGGDDYIVKPFRIAELRARVNAHIRREHREKHHALVLEGCRFDFHSHQKYSCKNGKRRTGFHKNGLGDWIQMGVNQSLKKVFANFLIKTILGLALAVCIPVLFFCVFVVFGEVNLANVSEIEAYGAVEEMKKTGQTEELLKELPDRIKYMVLDKEEKVVSTSMSTEEIKKTLEYLRQETISDNGTKRYISFRQGEKTIVLSYRVETYFTNSRLDNILPSPEKILIGIALIGIVINFILQVNRLERKFKMELTPILKAADEIGKQNLDYEIEHSKIKEFDDIQNALNDMKRELIEAFEKQWEMQRTQQEQIAALAHDLKTPMTVVMGNLDLLGETRLEGEQKELTEAATEGLVNMEKYIGTLMEVAVSSLEYQYQFRKFLLAEFEKQIVKQSLILCQSKDIGFHYENVSEDTEYLGDFEMLERAVLNIIRNAVEYTPEHGKIRVQVLRKDGFFCIRVSDTGKEIWKNCL